MWFVYALATTLLWGAADLFYKKGADERDKYSHLKTAMFVGLVMGLHAIYTLIFGNINYDFRNILVYLPVSSMYILSMVIGYFGLRYLQLSISSPVQNSSGAIVCILCLLILGQTLDAISVLGVILVCAGVILLGFLEKEENTLEDKKYEFGFIAFIFPVIYAIIDSIGTFLDAYYLDDAAGTPLINVTEETFEEVANTSYELTFLICAVLIFIYLLIMREKIEIPKQGSRVGAAVFETAGQFTYVFAMSGSGVVAAPMVASYSIVSVILSRIFLKEKLKPEQYVVVALVMIGIISLGISEGLAG